MPTPLETGGIIGLVVAGVFGVLDRVIAKWKPRRPPRDVVFDEMRQLRTELRADLADTRTRLENAEKRLGEVTLDLDECRRDSEQLHRENARLSTEIRDLHARLDTKDGEIALLRRTIEDLKGR